MLTKQILIILSICLILSITSLCTAKSNNESKSEDQIIKEYTVDSNAPREGRDLQKKFMQSYKTWIEAKEEHNDTYYYITTSASIYGFGSANYIVVREGVVVERSYKSYTFSSSEMSGGEYEWDYDIEEEFTETGDEIDANYVKTMDQLYDECNAILQETDTENNDIWFEVDDIGIMNSCGYYPHGCMDDCSEGISISEFGFEIQEFTLEN